MIQDRYIKGEVAPGEVYTLAELNRHGRWVEVGWYEAV